MSRVIIEPPVGRRLVSLRVVKDADGTWRWLVCVDFATRHGWEATSHDAWRVARHAMDALAAEVPRAA